MVDLLSSVLWLGGAIVGWAYASASVLAVVGLVIVNVKLVGLAKLSRKHG